MQEAGPLLPLGGGAAAAPAHEAAAWAFQAAGRAQVAAGWEVMAGSDAAWAAWVTLEAFVGRAVAFCVAAAWGSAHAAVGANREVPEKARAMPVAVTAPEVPVKGVPAGSPGQMMLVMVVVAGAEAVPAVEVLANPAEGGTAEGGLRGTGKEASLAAAAVVVAAATLT